MSLIVNFPTQSSKPSTSSKTVHFSSMSELCIYEDSGGNTDLFYTQQDYQEMRTAHRQSVRGARKLLSLTSSDSNANVQLGDFDFTGIENVASTDLMKKLILSRKLSCRAVLEEQARQDREGEYDVYKIARASQRHTKWVGERARKIGEHLQKSV